MLDDPCECLFWENPDTSARYVRYPIGNLNLNRN